MRHFLALWAVFFLCLSTALAEPTNETFRDGQVSGVVIDDALNQPLPYVNIVIKNSAGEIVTGGITDEDGSRGYYQQKELEDKSW